MVHFVLDFFKTKHGSGGAFRKQFKGFVLQLLTLMEDETNEVSKQ